MAQLTTLKFYVSIVQRQGSKCCVCHPQAPKLVCASWSKGAGSPRSGHQRQSTTVAAHGRCGQRWMMSAHHYDSSYDLFIYACLLAGSEERDVGMLERGLPTPSEKNLQHGVNWSLQLHLIRFQHKLLNQWLSAHVIYFIGDPHRELAWALRSQLFWMRSSENMHISGSTVPTYRSIKGKQTHSFFARSMCNSELWFKLKRYTSCTFQQVQFIRIFISVRFK